MTDFTARGMSRAFAEATGPVALDIGQAARTWWAGIDRWLVGAVMLLVAAGLVLALAASPPLARANDLWTYHYVARQAVFAALALGVMVALSTLDARTLRRGGTLVFAAAFAALVALPWFGTDFGKGAVRWFSLGFMSVQPSEFLKPAFVIVAAWLMAGSLDRRGPPGRLISGALAGLIALVLALQPAFGQALLVLAIWGTMLFVAGVSPILLGGIGALVGAALGAAYLTSEHVARRIDGFLAPEVAANTQLGYAESAIREGGLWGVGPAAGSVKWTLPDAHTDFIIAVAAEEFGLVATLAIAALFLFVSLRALTRLVGERSAFVRLAGTGLAVAIGVQAFVNLGVAVRLLPAKGMTLPFVSYGGSSMIAAALAMGALLALTRDRPPEPRRTLDPEPSA
ncbi:MAG: FtsW/RodA/SpoVE family cell cycle protein [Paracoccaceae bacterium]